MEERVLKNTWEVKYLELGEEKERGRGVKDDSRFLARVIERTVVPPTGVETTEGI